MKRVLWITLCLGLVLGCSFSALAEGIRIDGGYLLGGYDAGGLLKADAKGFILSGEAPISGPIGVQVNFASVSGSNFTALGVAVPDGAVSMDFTKTDLFATYALPLQLPDGASLKAIGGYTTLAASQTTHDPYGSSDTMNMTVSGFLVGGAGEFSPLDKLTLSGSFGVGLGVKSKAAGSPDSDMDATFFQISAAYKATDNVSVVGGYRSDKYTDKVSSMDQTIAGFFAGVRASF